jgi:large subunit ribosomal protein L3
MPGKRMAGQWGNESVSIRNLKIVDIIPEENVVLVRGSVPGARNSLVRLTKV